jgi:hypothetical protein
MRDGRATVDDRDLIVLAQKLHGFEGKIPWTQYFATLLRFMALQEKGGAGNRIRSTSKGRRRVIVASWLWPCHYIPEIEAALKDPSPERLRALLAFFRGVAVVHHLQAGRKLRKELSEVFAKEELTVHVGSFGASRKAPTVPDTSARDGQSEGHQRCGVVF